ncbi:hypothetical protein HYALB_00001480 [Hymenoscyphus albidus]|uniref:Uncharacterized protein n=1 Tax=Hymenoscyphus albidus TaxID=595503 RepID=A0A9N9LCM0_9HELO|nr:hypothetical protein HYALB_00001480 [Hymenoscyphus albidus]
MEKREKRKINQTPSHHTLPKRHLATTPLLIHKERKKREKRTPIHPLPSYPSAKAPSHVNDRSSEKEKKENNEQVSMPMLIPCTSSGANDFGMNKLLAWASPSQIEKRCKGNQANEQRLIQILIQQNIPVVQTSINVVKIPAPTRSAWVAGLIGSSVSELPLPAFGLLSLVPPVAFVRGAPIGTRSMRLTKIADMAAIS